MSDDDHDSFGGMPSPGGPPSPGSRPGTPTNIESAVAGVMGIASALSPSRPHSSASHPKSPRRTNDDRAAEGPERSMQGIARNIECVVLYIIRTISTFRNMLSNHAHVPLHLIFYFQLLGLSRQPCYKMRTKALH